MKNNIYLLIVLLTFIACSNPKKATPKEAPKATPEATLKENTKKETSFRVIMTTTIIFI